MSTKSLPPREVNSTQFNKKLLTLIGCKGSLFYSCFQFTIMRSDLCWYQPNHSFLKGFIQFSLMSTKNAFPREVFSIQFYEILRSCQPNPSLPTDLYYCSRMRTNLHWCRPKMLLQYTIWRWIIYRDINQKTTLLRIYIISVGKEIVYIDINPRGFFK